MIRFTRVSAALGADVHGVDLSKPLSEEDVQRLREGLTEHQVLFIREQPLLSEEQQLALARRFGEIEPPPFPAPETERRDQILELDRSSAHDDVAAQWHADNTFRRSPPMGALLQAHILPGEGRGDTCFASMHAAYEALSSKMKQYLDGLYAYHSLDRMVSRLGLGGRLAINPRDHPPVKHPVIAAHPRSGRPTLFVNTNWTSHIDGVERDESDAILKYLYEHVKKPEFQTRLRWNVGDVAFWDNRATQHYALPDYSTRRLMHRVSIVNDEPVSPASAAP